MSKQATQKTNKWTFSKQILNCRNSSLRAPKSRMEMTLTSTDTAKKEKNKIYITFAVWRFILKRRTKKKNS